MILFASGAVLTAGSLVHAVRHTPKADLRRVIVRTLQAMKLENVQIRKISRSDNVFNVQFKLPAGFTSTDFLNEVKQPLDEVTFAGGTKFKKIKGNIVEMSFGYEEFHEKMNYRTGMGKGMSIPLYSPFGMKYLDFSDETSCHLLIGGTTRMGKSVFIRLLATHLITKLNGEVDLYMFDNKINDLYPFRNIPQIRMAETIAEAGVYLDDLMKQVQDRKEILKSKGDIVDANEFRKKYPDEKMNPIFIIIDEYARFADDKTFQENVMAIAETAGYLDVHLIVASQRPDVQTVLKPRIRANMLTRLAFTTSDEANSKLILDIPDAAHLDRIQGRAILSDGMATKVQVPYLAASIANSLLDPYRKDDIIHERKGPDDSTLPEALQDLVSRPLGELSSFGECEPVSNNQPRSKAPRKRGRNTSGSTL